MDDQKTHRMTPEEDQTKLFQAGESFIADMDNALTAAGGHPEPPYPRIRP